MRRGERQRQEVESLGIRVVWIKDADTLIKPPEGAPQQGRTLDTEQQDVKKGEPEEQGPMVDTASSPVSGEITSPKVRQSQRPGPRATFGDQTPMVRRDLQHEERFRRNNEYIERLRQDPDSKTIARHPRSINPNGDNH